MKKILNLRRTFLNFERTHFHEVFYVTGFRVFGWLEKRKSERKKRFLYQEF